MTIMATLLCLAVGPMGLAGSAVGQAVEETMHEGTVVSISGNTLVMADLGGKQAQYHVADSAQVTINGNLAKLSDLKPRMRIRVMTNKVGEVTVINTVDDVKRTAPGTGLEAAVHPSNSSDPQSTR